MYMLIRRRNSYCSVEKSQIYTQCIHIHVFVFFITIDIFFLTFFSILCEFVLRTLWTPMFREIW